MECARELILILVKFMGQLKKNPGREFRGVFFSGPVGIVFNV